MSSATPRASSPLLPLVGALVVVVLLAGCSSGLFSRVSGKGAKAEAARSDATEELQLKSMRLADEYVGRVLDAANAAQRSPRTTPQARLQLEAWKLEQANSAYTSASGPRPGANLLDLYVLATLSRRISERIAPAAFGAESGALVAVHRELESEVWVAVDELLDPEAEAAVREIVDAWSEQNPDVRTVGFVRFAAFAEQTGAPVDGSGKTPNSLLGLLRLDPLEGLDPAVRQIEQTRLLAERATYFAQRLPYVLDLQLRYSLQSIAAAPETQGVLADANRASLAAESVAATAAGLPDLVAREREALIRGLWGGMAANEQALRELVTDLRAALAAGDQTAGSVREATVALDGLVARFQRPKDPGAPPSRPFDITEYTRAAEEIARTAAQVQALAAQVDAQAPALQRAFGDAGAQMRAIVDGIFWRAVALIVLTVACVLLAALAYARLARTSALAAERRGPP